MTDREARIRGMHQCLLESWTRYFAVHVALVLLVLLLKLQGIIAASRASAPATAALESQEIDIERNHNHRDHANGNGIHTNGAGPARKEPSSGEPLSDMSANGNGHSSAAASHQSTLPTVRDHQAFLHVVKQFCTSGLHQMVDDIVPIVRLVLENCKFGAVRGYL